MRTLVVFAILMQAALPAFAADSRAVLLAANRASGRIEAYDAPTLYLLGGIGVNHGVESISVSPNGRTLYVAQESASAACCTLYSVDLETHAMCTLVGSAMFAAPSADGRFLFTQIQGSRGVDVIEAADSGARLFTMRAPRSYHLQPSPDGRWLFGIANSPTPSLDIFDMNAKSLAHRVAVPRGPITGAWAGDRFEVFSYSAPGVGELWTVRSGDFELSQPRQIQLRDLHGACDQPVLLMLAGAPGRLFLAEAYGYKLDRRRACPDGAPGGIYAIDPASGHVDTIARSVHVNRMIVDNDGRDLYVIESGNRSIPGSVRLVHIDARTGNTLGKVPLESGDWSLALAHIPLPLLPRGYVRAASACTR